MIQLGLDEERWSEAAEARELSYDQFASMGLTATPVAAGVPVTAIAVNGLAAARCAQSMISDTVGMLDRHAFRRVGEDDRQRATSLPVYRLVHDEPNDYQTGIVFWSQLVAHAVGYGNGYAEIEFDRALRPIALHNLLPTSIRPAIDATGPKPRLVYRYDGAGGQKTIEAEDILHIHGPGFDGLQGYSPVFLFRQSLGISLAMEQFAGAFFGNGAWGGAAVKVKKKLTPDARQEIRAFFENMHRGAGNAHRTMILEEDTDVSKPLTIAPDDAQFLESRAFQVEEIARIYKISPHKLMANFGKWPGGTPEQGQIDFMTDTIMPWTTQVEQECDRKLIPKAQRSTYYVEHNFDKMLKADTTARMGAWTALSALRVVGPGYIARKENIPSPESQPDIAPVPPAAPPMPAPVATAPEPPLPPVGGKRDQLVASLRAVLLAEVGRFARREAEKARNAAKKGAAGLGPWMEAFYSGAEEGVFRDCLAPHLAFAMVALGSEGDAGGLAADFARTHMERSKAELEELDSRQVSQAVPRLLKRWETTRTAEIVEEIIAAVAAEQERAHVA